MGLDVWEWDGSDWTFVPRLSTPSSRNQFGMAHDARRGRTVVFSGANDLFSDTWEWDGARWIERFSATRPAGRSNTAMAFDSRRGRVVMYGGLNIAFFHDTWELATSYPAAQDSLGTGCVGTGGTPSLLPEPGGLPWLGGSCRLQVTVLAGRTHRPARSRHVAHASGARSRCLSTSRRSACLGALCTARSTSSIRS
jgi:hypothetical protein